MNRIKNFVYRNRHNIAVFVLLNLACAACIALVGARVVYTDSSRHTGLIWNLFLAWIPFILAYFAHALSRKRVWVYLAIPFIAMLWLLFFPNAPYMLTDLQDLARGTGHEAPLWYDVIIVVWCSWTGTLLGVISLKHLDRSQSQIGYWVAPAFWHGGIASAAVKAVLDVNPHANATVFAEVFQDNPVSARLLTHAGFEYIGDAEAWSIARNAAVPTWTYLRRMA